MFLQSNDLYKVHYSKIVNAGCEWNQTEHLYRSWLRTEHTHAIAPVLRELKPKESSKLAPGYTTTQSQSWTARKGSLNPDAVIAPTPFTAELVSMKLPSFTFLYTQHI